MPLCCRVQVGFTARHTISNAALVLSHTVMLALAPGLPVCAVTIRGKPTVPPDISELVTVSGHRAGNTRATRFNARNARILQRSTIRNCEGPQAIMAPTALSCGTLQVRESTSSCGPPEHTFRV